MCKGLADSRFFKRPGEGRITRVGLQGCSSEDRLRQVVFDSLCKALGMFHVCLEEAPCPVSCARRSPQSAAGAPGLLGELG